MTTTSVTGTGSGSPLSSLINQPAPTTTGNTVLGENDFLTLLTTQMQNQDPTQPMDNTQMVAQLAQFSSLQETTNLANAFQSFQSTFSVTQMAGFIGKSVTVDTSNGGQNNGSLISGTVGKIEVQNGQPYFTMTDANGNVISDSNGNPALFTPSQIVTVG
ncbi:MAG TPA: flagellar hook capping FlgD N-terminal domain-containing protein [Candidatus Dormibacteraeota bacterium]|nr:flagellar hook capping FlgD N-terminal domain-containing protein [Candidatus Dormibacteraeota bacterium]